jgi:hypothetical protein
MWQTGLREGKTPKEYGRLVRGLLGAEGAPYLERWVAEGRHLETLTEETVDHYLRNPETCPYWRMHLLWMLDHNPLGALEKFRKGTLLKYLDQQAAKAYGLRLRLEKAGKLDREEVEEEVADRIAAPGTENAGDPDAILEKDRAAILEWSLGEFPDREVLIT